MISLNSRVVAAADQVSSDLGGETAILNLKNGVYYGLDEVGSRIWALIQQPITVSQLSDILYQEYDVSWEQCQHDILTLLAELSSEKLINWTDEPSA